ncbi:hypothetical protein [Hymenobacter negativus]|uniref:hypothetical protein n=1 Tax=Hymenobacter negativus TaxID=2795026 RepID=UPI001AAF0EC5|nr:hypothetical protein [Hymenobacter negativus]
MVRKVCQYLRSRFRVFIGNIGLHTGSHFFRAAILNRATKTNATRWETCASGPFPTKPAWTSPVRDPAREE